MRIILSNYRYFISGGPEKYLFSIQDSLRSYGHEVFPFSVKSTKNQPSEYEDHFLSAIGNEGDVYFHQYKKTAKTILKVMERQIYSPEAFFKGRSFAKFTKADVVYSLNFMSKMSPALLDGFKAAGLPVVLRISDFGLICPQGHLFDGTAVCTLCLDGNYFHAVQQRCIMKSGTAGFAKALALSIHRLLGCWERIDAFVFPSRFTLEMFVKAGFSRQKLHYLPTPIDVQSIIPAYTNKGTLLYFGRLTVEKGIHQLLSAYRNIGGEKPPLIIVGAQATTPYSKALMEEYSEVSFYDFLPQQQLAAYIRDALCVIIPSIWYDNLPNVLLEAYSHGKPVIAPAHGSFLELVADGNTGLLYEPGSIPALQEKICWALENSGAMAEMGKKARAWVEAEFSPERHYAGLMSIFSSVL